MSPIRYRGRHRKPRTSRTVGLRLIRGGVLSGVVGTVAVTGTAGPASATEQPAESTGELPVVSAALATSSSRAAQATEDLATHTEQRQALAWAQERAIVTAQRTAAEQRAEAEQRAAEEAAARQAAEEAALAEERAAAEEAANESAAEAANSPEVSTLSAPAPSGGAAAVLDFARSQLGDAYVMGGTGPDSWDCSGLVQAAFQHVGISLPRVSGDQAAAGTQVSLDALQAGDILWWGSSPGSAYHVAIYTGNGTFVGAQNASTGVVERELSYDAPSGAVRVL
ncbi:glycoside hydrolase [Streptomyces sp. 3MP-14]|uniref:Glycoside hydrolase n=1 Tax=Streptomyces mimosae TaxID=2586635 RepID=A0A5N6AEK8_9ACTN|nr:MULTISPECIES: C40 family peptidase [Streptomyces]KAB8167091.1 glycoside hydrolase [Streptomyces mimosae]KAB8177032.1 glycoside hydrolase [Streptomyces sp. 3MP-14]